MFISVDGGVASSVGVDVRACDIGEELTKDNICSPCPPGKYSLSDGGSCQPCPVHGVCPGRNVVYADSGYYLTEQDSVVKVLRGQCE